MAKAKAVTARRRTTVVTDEVGDGSEIAIGNGADKETPETETDALGELLGVASDDAVFKAYKQPEKAGERQAYAGSYSKDELSLDTIRDTYGGGTYRIVQFNKLGQYQGSKTVAILGLPKSAAAPAAANSNSDLMQMMLMKMMDGQASVMAALAARPQAEAKQPSVMEIIQLIKAMEPKGDSTEILLKGFELARTMGGGGGEPGMLDVAMKGLTALTAAAEASKGKVPDPAPIQQQRLPQPAPTPKEPEDMNIVLQMKRLQWLKTTVAVLIGHAARGKNPQLYADVFVDNIPEFVDEAELLSQFERPDALDVLAAIAPDVKKHAAWFEEFRKAVLENYADEGDETDTLGQESPPDDLG